MRIHDDGTARADHHAPAFIGGQSVSVKASVTATKRKKVKKTSNNLNPFARPYEHAQGR
jgi:hypothetical protein